MLSEQLLSTFSSPCYGVKIVYNYGIWKREVQEGLLVFGVYPFLPFFARDVCGTFNKDYQPQPPPPPCQRGFFERAAKHNL